MFSGGSKGKTGEKKLKKFQLSVKIQKTKISHKDLSPYGCRGNKKANLR